jgi:hypothetical protein
MNKLNTDFILDNETKVRKEYITHELIDYDAIKEFLKDKVNDSLYEYIENNFKELLKETYSPYRKEFDFTLYDLGEFEFSSDWILENAEEPEDFVINGEYAYHIAPILYLDLADYVKGLEKCK